MPAYRVTTPGDPRLEPFRDLRDRDRRSRDGLFVVETRAVVRELLASRFRTRAILVNEAGVDALSPLPDDVAVFVAPIEMMREVVGFKFHRGCLALGERTVGPSLDDVLDRTPHRLVVLDEVTDPDNVGAVFRNARAFGTDAVLLSPGCADPLYRKAIRVSMGASLLVPFTHVDDVAGAVARLRADGITVLALTPRGGVDLATLAPPARAALLLGTEGPGLDPSLIDAADVRATIPMESAVDSLNVATAAAIALHALRPVATAPHGR
jgi:tRNA G18 (ribose-2'-O)-methylase SpoU